MFTGSTFVEHGHRFVRGPRLELHIVRSFVMALWTYRIRFRYVLPSRFASKNIIHFFRLKLCRFRDWMLGIYFAYVRTSNTTKAKPLPIRTFVIYNQERAIPRTKLHFPVLYARFPSSLSPRNCISRWNGLENGIGLIVVDQATVVAFWGFTLFSAYFGCGPGLWGDKGGVS